MRLASFGVLVVGILLFPACLLPVTEDGGVTDGGVRCVDYSGEQVCAVVPKEVSCGLATCGVGQECCQTSGECVALGSSGCSSGATQWPNGRACARQSDCGADEFCMSDDSSRCLAQGHCQSINNCGYCGAPGTARCQVCGCNGTTYSSIQEACVAGVRAVVGPCGVAAHDAGAADVRCGNAGQCPAGSQCCAITGRCFAPSESWRCEEQPDGSILDCVSTGECNSGAGGGAGGDRVCDGNACGGPGLCRPRGSTSSCGGDVNPVCGCDGQNYVNACWARAAGTRVAHGGNCP